MTGPESGCPVAPAMPANLALPDQVLPLPTERAAAPWKVMACAVVLVAATLAAFWPTVHARFIAWDDPDYVYFRWKGAPDPSAVMERDDTLLRDTAGLKTIWNPLSAKTQQYYPLVFTSYWIEYQLWKLDPRGFHSTNLVLHAVNVVLVLALLRQVGVPLWVAVFSAGVFALHPTQVASVAWVAERKNTLSGLFYLTAFLLYIRCRRTNGWLAYAACVAAFVAGMLSKTQVLTFPLSALLMDWILSRSGRMTKTAAVPALLRVVPMLLIGVAAAVLTIHVEHARNLSLVRPSLLERAYIVPNSAWYYAGTFLWPVDLSLVYAWNKVRFGSPFLLLGVLAWPVVLLLLRRGVRTRLIDGFMLWGLVHFFIALAPVLGVVPFNYQQYSFVADHYLYLSNIGGGLAVGMAGYWFATHRTSTAASTLGPVSSALPTRVRRLAATLAAIVALATCGLLTRHETKYWMDTEAFMTRAIEKNSNCYSALFNLGNYYKRAGRWDKAVPLYQRAAEIAPLNTLAYQNYTAGVAALQGAAAATQLDRERLAKARASEARGDYEDAFRRYRSVAAAAPHGSPEQQEARQGVARTQPRRP